MDDKRHRFDEQVLPHLDAAYRFARWLSRSAPDAEDVVQEALLRALRGFDGLRGSDAKAWLLAIVRNCHATAARRELRRRQLPLPAEDDAQHGHVLVASTEDPANRWMQQDAERLLERLLATLPPEQREVLLLREIEELDYRQIAAVVQVPVGTVMSRLWRARAALKSRWDAEENAHDLP